MQGDAICSFDLLCLSIDRGKFFNSENPALNHDILFDEKIVNMASKIIFPV